MSIARPIYANNFLLAYSLDESIEDAKNLTHGKVLSAETIQNQQKKIHNIRILTKSGKVKRIQYDEQTGQRINNSRSFRK
ncbi:MAG: hypothetical protein HQL46_12105 [Gammaproteobacteria bacterium]|nr:hypothetical protein [Gammaproteobacteria bacterium]